MQNNIIRYDSVCKEVSELRRIDEVKNIRDKAVAIQMYAKQANNRQLLSDATKIRLLAERRWGILYREQEKAKANGSNQYKKVERSQVTTAPLPTLKDMGVSKTQSVKWQRFAALPTAKFEAKLEQATAKVENYSTTAPRHSKSEFSGEVEWYTPKDYLDLVRKTLGVIDLDPASSNRAQRTVKAKKHFTITDDGLAHQWSGRVWLNPPYMQPHVANFMAKLINEYSSGRVTEAIMLTHNYTDTEWFHNGANNCDAICFTRGRIKFYNNEGEIAAPTQGQAFFYFGKNKKKFADKFAKVGFVMEMAK